MTTLHSKTITMTFLKLISLLISCTTLWAQTYAPVSETLVIPPDYDVEEVKTQGHDLIKEVALHFVEKKGASVITPPEGQSIRLMIVPLQKDLDNFYFTDSFGSIIAEAARSAGYRVFTRNDDELKHLIGQIQFNSEQEAILDASTKVQLQAKGISVVLQPRLDIREGQKGLTLRAGLKGQDVSGFERIGGCDISPTHLIKKAVDVDGLVTRIAHFLDHYKVFILIGLGCAAIFQVISSLIRKASSPR